MKSWMLNTHTHRVKDMCIHTDTLFLLVFLWIENINLYKNVGVGL